MMRTAFLRPKFVRAIPEKLDAGMLYVSIDFATVAHSCCCGCGREVVTPLTPTDWKITYDGVSISLFPSIGNWNFPCRSHYGIDSGRVVWASQWSDDMIAANRARDRFAKQNYYAGQYSVTAGRAAPPPAPAPPSSGFWAWVASLFRKVGEARESPANHCNAAGTRAWRRPPTGACLHHDPRDVPQTSKWPRPMARPF
jgi:Family of unknown function (DUF6527)